MARYIDIDKINKWYTNPNGCGGVGYCLGGMFSDCIECYYRHDGAEDVTHIVHAKWKTITEPFHDVGDDYVTRECSICGGELTTHIDYKTPYCPNCGAKMDKE